MAMVQRRRLELHEQLQKYGTRESCIVICIDYVEAI